MTEVNEALIHSVRFHNEVESLVRNGDQNVLTGSKVRRAVEERFGLERDTLRAEPWKTMVNKILDNVLVKIQQEQDVDMDEAKPESQAIKKDEAQVKPEEKDVVDPKDKVKLEENTVVKSEENDEEKPVKLEDASISEPSDEDVAEDLVVKKPSPKKKRTPKEKKSIPSAKASKAKVKKEKSPSKSEDSSDEEATATKTKGRKKPDDKKKNSPSDEKIERLKTYIRKCGVRKKWVAEFAGLTTQGQKIKKLESILHDLGVEGHPTLKKCEQVKQERELKADIAGLDTDNILGDEGNSRRSTRRSQPIKRKRQIIASDEDEDEDVNPSKVARTSSPGLDVSFLGDQGSDSD